MGQARKNMTHIEMYKVYGYIDTHRDLFASVSPQEAITKIEVGTGHLVCVNAVKKAFDAFGMPFITSRSLKVTEAKEIRTQINTLAHAINELFVDCTDKQHPGVAAIIEFYNSK